MSVLSDIEIRDRCEGKLVIGGKTTLKHPPMISPFVEKLMGSPSFGLSSYGYDIRLADEFATVSRYSRYEGAAPRQDVVLDPLNFPSDHLVTYDSGMQGYVDLPPFSFTLARSVEEFDIPRDIFVVCLGKSSYARCGLIVNVTPLEPEWKGHLTLELSNTTEMPVRVRPGMGIAQLVFHKANRACGVSYADRKGKYQDQRGITVPR